jgi:hypothetical protein
MNESDERPMTRAELEHDAGVLARLASAKKRLLGETSVPPVEHKRNKGASHNARRLRELVRHPGNDDYERALAAFGHLTDAQLDELHGQSGLTRRQILEGYALERHAQNELIAFVEDLLTARGL